MAVITGIMLRAEAAMMRRCWMGTSSGEELDAEVAAGDHRAVGLGEDGIEVLDGLAALDLGDDGRVGAERSDELARVHHVFGVANEAQGEEVDAGLHAGLDGFPVAVGEGGHGEVGVGEADALVASRAGRR